MINYDKNERRVQNEYFYFILVDSILNTNDNNCSSSNSSFSANIINNLINWLIEKYLLYLFFIWKSDISSDLISSARNNGGKKLFIPSEMQEIQLWERIAVVLLSCQGKLWWFIWSDLINILFFLSQSSQSTNKKELQTLQTKHNNKAKAI